MTAAEHPIREKTTELVLGDPETPLAWGLLAWVAVAVAVSVGLTWALGRLELSLFTIVPCILAGVVAANAPYRRALTAATVFAVALSLLQALAVGVAHMPVVAAVLLALVTFFATAMSAVPHWSSTGALIAMGYFVSAVYGYVMDIEVSTPATYAALLGLLGALLGGVIVTLYRRARARKVGHVEAGFMHATAPPLVDSLRAMLDVRNAEVQFALVRGLLSGVGMWAFLYSGADRNAAWIFLTAFMTLQPALKRTLQSGLLRVAGTAGGVLAFGLLVAVLPTRIASYLALGGLAIGLLFIQRSVIMSNLGMTMFIIAIFGQVRGEFFSWAIARLIDVVIGGGVAVLLGFVALPAIRAFQERRGTLRKATAGAAAGGFAAGTASKADAAAAQETDSALGGAASGESADVGSDIGSTLPGG